ncbi:MAG: glycosyltransferase family 4 protein [Desulfobacteraceae bacterium]|nr:glycosyltransferase family 4 protein [Desulfobacteraceae bacterium]MBC2749213.1 glycosyltransferase family 4 protein [Desulfobacteraceae bacterium]
MNRRKVGFIWDGNYPWDIRVEKICLSLIESGHEVHLVCRNTRFEARKERCSGIHIHRLPAIRPHGLNSLLNFPFFFNPIWYANIKRIFNRVPIDIAIVRDITLSLTTLWAAQERQIPVILDMAEPYPEMIRAQLEFGDLSGLQRLIRRPELAHWVEKKTLRGVKKVFAMVEESQRRICSMGVPDDKVIIVSNTPDLRKFKAVQKSYPGIMAHLKSKTIFLYVGFIDFYRGVQVAVEGFQSVVKKHPDSVLVVIGSGGATTHVKALATSLGLSEHVYFEGYQEHFLIPEYISACDVGVITHFACGLWNNTIPNKLFDYMAMNKPVLSSDASPVKRILEEEKCGMTYDSKSTVDFAKAASRLTDPTLRAFLGANGRSAIERRYNWDWEAKEIQRQMQILG